MRLLMLLLALVLTPIVALAAPRTFAELMYEAVTYMNAITDVLVLATLVMYLGGAARYAWKSRSGGSVEDARKFLMVGIVIMFVMVSIWGILRILQNTLSSGGGELGGGGEGQSHCAGLDNCSDL